jgi:glycosyltransferase involved in cell wall biosynthesis
LKKTDVEKKTPPRVLWVGTIKPLWKQPNLFLEVAKKIPETQFIMIGGRSLDNEFFLKIKHEAESIPNLEFKGFIPLSRIEEFFKEASIFVNTSTNEGFPNTFLQAWANYTPVISLNIDPDEIICKYTLGFHSKNFEQFIRDLQLLLDDSDLRQKMGSNGRKYVEDNHDFDLIMERYIALLASIE